MTVANLPTTMTHLDDNDEDGPSNILNRQVGPIRPIE